LEKNLGTLLVFVAVLGLYLMHFVQLLNHDLARTTVIVLAIVTAFSYLLAESLLPDSDST